MARKSFSRKERARLFTLNGGACYLCAGKIGVAEAYDIEHEIPWEISRDDSDENLRLAHKKCHAVKTKADRKDISKVHRMEAKHKGFWPKSKTPMRSKGFQPTRGALWPASANREGD